jgi:hypothetical protein
VFKSALATLPDETFLTIMIEVLDDYIERKRRPSRFDGSNVHDGDPDFDLLHQWREYEKAMIAALG